MCKCTYQAVTNNRHDKTIVILLGKRPWARKADVVVEVGDAVNTFVDLKMVTSY